MLRRRLRTSPPVTAGVLAVAASLLVAASASAELTGEFKRFANCPTEAGGIYRCVSSVTTGGEVVLGAKTVPIVNDVTLQGGYTKPDKEDEGFSKFIAASSGDSLSKTPQPVPGGLTGLVPPEEAPPLVLAALEPILENGLTEVNSTLEIAGDPSDIKVHELNLALGEGVALVLPLKAHLENPFLGENCYVGSDSNPIYWELRTDATSPPPPNKSIEGDAGEIEFLEEGLIVEISGTVLVDNAWSAPEANGCAGALSVLVDPIINAQAGLPAEAGENTAILENTIFETTAAAVKLNDEENP